MQELVSLLPLVAIALLFWFLVIRPAQRRQKNVARMQSALSVGDEVMLTSGVFGTLRALADDHLLVEVAPGVELKVVRAAVGTVVRESDAAHDAPGNQANQDTHGAPGGTTGAEDL